MTLKADTHPPLHTSHRPQQSSLVPGSHREEEPSDGSVEDDPEDDDDIATGTKGRPDGSAPNTLDATPGIDTSALPVGHGNSRQRIRIRGYRPLDELRSFAKVLITSLNREFVTPRLDYSAPCPACLSEGLGDAHIMGATLYAQMRRWLSDPNVECARDMAAYFKVSLMFTQPLLFFCVLCMPFFISPAFQKVKGEFGVPNRANRYHVEYTLKKFLLPKVVVQFCQRRLLTEIMLEKSMPADYYTRNPEDLPHIDQEHKDTFVRTVHSVLAEVDKLWPMFPSTDEIDDEICQTRNADSDLNLVSGARASSPPPVNNAFQFYGRFPGRSLQHENSTKAAGQPSPNDAAREMTSACWIRPWDSVFDRKKNGFGTFFAKEVLELCHCDETTICRILGISMRHIAVKKSEMVLQFALFFAFVLLAARSSKNRAVLPWPPQIQQQVSLSLSLNASATHLLRMKIRTICHLLKCQR
jgi:hypothetical protein